MQKVYTKTESIVGNVVTVRATDVRLGDLETPQDTVHRRPHVAAHSRDAGVHVDDGRVAVR